MINNEVEQVPAPKPPVKIPVFAKVEKDSPRVRAVRFTRLDREGQLTLGSSLLCQLPGETSPQSLQRYLARHPEYLTGILLPDVFIAEASLPEPQQCGVPLPTHEA